MIDLTPIVNAFITLIGLLLTTFLIPWIRTKISNEKLKEIQKWTAVGVKAAEMIYNESGICSRRPLRLWRCLVRLTRAKKRRRIDG